MMKPQRIQRKRTKGWRMPPDAVYVGRPSRWGNPWSTWPGANKAVALAVALYRLWVTGGLGGSHPLGPPPNVAPLRGHDLVCWCPLDQPCHADVLLELLNSPDDAARWAG